MFLKTYIFIQQAGTLISVKLREELFILNVFVHVLLICFLLMMNAATTVAGSRCLS